MPSTDNPHKATDDEIEELHNEAKKAVDVLIKASSVFPFVLFPDTIAVSRTKVAITIRTFFKVTEVISLQISDILNVEADTGPFFGSLKIYTRIYGTAPLRITFLSRKDTIAVKRVLEGYVIANMKQMDISNLERKELVGLLKSLGSDAPLT